MRINIPAILAGQGGYADAIVHDLAPAVKQLSQAVAMATSSIQDQYAYNNLANYEDGPEGLKIQESTYHNEYWQKQDGSDPNAMENYELGLRDLQRSYVDKSRAEAGDMVADLMDKRAQLRSQKYYEEAARVQGKLFFNNSVQANELRANQAAKDLAPHFGNPEVIRAAMAASDAEAESQRGVFGFHTDTVKRNRRAVIVENGMRIGLSDETISPGIARAIVSNPDYKSFLFSHVPAERADELNRLLYYGHDKAVASSAYAELTTQFTDAKTGRVDYRAAASAALSPEIAAKYGLTIDQQQNISQSFGARHAAEEQGLKETQAENMEPLYALAVNDPGKALSEARRIARANDGRVDPKELYNFQKALESHYQNMRLMSAQERQIRQDLEDKGKARIKVNILSGAYKSKEEVINAVLSGGFQNTSGLMDEAVSMWEKDRKENFDQVNYFKNAVDDWNFNITTMKQKARKRELKDMQPQIENTLAAWMVKNNISKTDPRVMEQYRLIKKEALKTTFDKMIDGVSSAVGIGQEAQSDTFVIPKQPPKALDVYPVGTRRSRINPETKAKETEIWDGEKWVKAGR